MLDRILAYMEKCYIHQHYLKQRKNENMATVSRYLEYKLNESFSSFHITSFIGSVFVHIFVLAFVSFSLCIFIFVSLCEIGQILDRTRHEKET